AGAEKPAVARRSSRNQRRNWLELAKAHGSGAIPLDWQDSKGKQKGMKRAADADAGPADPDARE
ncbi:hypothetical protein LTR16_005492, partial [Cryomyces antarcticus]